MKIAVLVDEKGNTVEYSNNGIIKLYVSEDGKWLCIKKMPFKINEGTTISEIRERIHAIRAEIEDSKVFIVETMKSLPIAIFDGYGVTVWNHKGDPTVAFDFVQEQETNKAHQPKSCCDSPSCKSTCSSSFDGVISSTSPVAIGNLCDGFYTIDLAKVLASDRTLNSKQILIPFLQNTAFKKLEVICEHVPKWFENELNTLKMQFKEENTNYGMCRVMVYPKE
jgi:Fe-only nitrogenase accessory protein AnfO